MATASSTPRLGGAVGAFRAIAIVEAVTYLALLAAVLLYRVFDGPDFIGLLGPIHGIAFLVYLFLVLRIREGQGWGLWRTAIIVIAAAVPLGGFWAGRHLRDEEATTGGGHEASGVTATGAPGPSHSTDQSP